MNQALAKTSPALFRPEALDEYHRPRREDPELLRCPRWARRAHLLLLVGLAAAVVALTRTRVPVRSQGVALLKHRSVPQVSGPPVCRPGDEGAGDGAEIVALFPALRLSRNDQMVTLELGETSLAPDRVRLLAGGSPEDGDESRSQELRAILASTQVAPSAATRSAALALARVTPAELGAIGLSDGGTGARFVRAALIVRTPVISLLLRTPGREPR